jgi:hypothetical protein
VKAQPKKELSAERLRELLNYDCETGVFTWAGKPNNRVVIGSKAGSITAYGYSAIRIDATRYLAHRLAWLWVYSTWPKGEIDHANGDRMDNRIANLRDCSPGQNRQNMRAAHSRNKSGLLGVSWSKQKGKWWAQIAVGGKHTHIGFFENKEIAYEAYVRKKRELHPFGGL